MFDARTALLEIAARRGVISRLTSHRLSPADFASRRLRILTKDKCLVPLVYNPVQADLMTHLTGRDLVLKARQHGVSTAIQGLLYQAVVTGTATTMTLAHDDDSTKTLRRIADRFHAHDPLKPQRGAANDRLSTYPEHDSEALIATAGNKTSGRSTTLTHLHGCLSPDTPVVSGDSGKLIRMGDLDVDDLIVTHLGNVAPISFVSHKSADTNKITLRGLCDFPLIATLEHRFWTCDGWKRLAELKAGDSIGYPVQVIRLEHSGWLFRLPDSARPQGGGRRETGPDTVQPTYELGRILGLYLAEGCLIKQSKGKQLSAVTFSVHEREADRTCTWLNSASNLFVSYTVAPTRNSKTVHITVYGRSFATFVHELCGELDEKHFPTYWERCGDSFVRGVVHGYLSGDGHFSPSRDRRISATSIRSAITIELRSALASLGYGWACIEYKPAGIRAGRNEREAWTLRLCGEGVDRLSKELNKPYIERQRRKSDSVKYAIVANGYAWIPIVSIEPFGEIDVMDFEIGHEDHSYCTIHGATHNSEVAFWPDAESIMGSALQAGEPQAVLESTPNGAQGYFYALCMEAMDGSSEWTLHFYPWWAEAGYRISLLPDEHLDYSGEELALVETHGLAPEQIKWRRAKKAELKHQFAQEYAEDPRTCFLLSGNNYFGDVSAAAIASLAPEYCADHRYVAGLDFGQANDFTALDVVDASIRHEVAWLRVNRLPWAEMRRQIAVLCHDWHVRTLVAEANAMGTTNIEELQRELKAIGCATTLVQFWMSNESKASLAGALHETLHQVDGLKTQADPVRDRELAAFVAKQLPSLVWRLEAAANEHDDTVIARMLAWYGVLNPQGVWFA